MIKLIVAFRYFEKAPEKLRMNALYVVFIYIYIYMCVCVCVCMCVC